MIHYGAILVVTEDYSLVKNTRQLLQDMNLYLYFKLYLYLLGTYLCPYLMIVFARSNQADRDHAKSLLQTGGCSLHREPMNIGATAKQNRQWKVSPCRCQENIFTLIEYAYNVCRNHVQRVN